MLDENESYKGSKEQFFFQQTDRIKTLWFNIGELQCSFCFEIFSLSFNLIDLLSCLGQETAYKSFRYRRIKNIIALYKHCAEQNKQKN